MNIIRGNIKGALNLERNIAIDETLVKFKGRVGFRQFLPAKPGRFGVKNFTLSESSSGYVWDLDVYTGKTGHDPKKALAYHVVRKLVQGLEGKGFNLFVDNWYSSPQLFQDLAEVGILACGTVRANRKGLPSDIMNLKAKDIKSMKEDSLCLDRKGTSLPVHGRTLTCSRIDNHAYNYCLFSNNKVSQREREVDAKGRAETFSY